MKKIVIGQITFWKKDWKRKLKGGRYFESVADKAVSDESKLSSKS